MRRLMYMLMVLSLCGFFFVFGAWQKSGYSNREYGKGDRIALRITKETECSILTNLNVEKHGRVASGAGAGSIKVFEPCHERYRDHTPCHDPIRAMEFRREDMEYWERHCPLVHDKLRCLVPAPNGYLAPFRWPKSRDYVPLANVPYDRSSAFREIVEHRGNLLRFPGRGELFPRGVDAYIEEISAVVPMSDGLVRTALDIGCAFASWGAYMLKRNIISMSFAPRNFQNSQVHYALERGVPAVLGVLGTMKLPYPSRAFDLVHCSHCQVPWTSNDGMHMMEVDRVLRPGGYLVLSGPPINSNANYPEQKRTTDELQVEQRKIERLADLLCWEKKYEEGGTAIWRKKKNAFSCTRSLGEFSIKLCRNTDADDVWNVKMQSCIFPFVKVKNPDEVSGGQLKKFPERLFSVPPRVSQGYISGITAESYGEVNKMWKNRVENYRMINKLIGSSRYRNIMDMNAGVGGFAAALLSNVSWVMNVVPTISGMNTLGIIYERGMIGIHHDWCEAFSTYPRTYDLIHASELFSLYHGLCAVEDILLEMDRILRPEGAVIIHDDPGVLIELQMLASGMRWDTEIVDLEEGGPQMPPPKVLVAVKKYWTSTSAAASEASSSSQLQVTTKDTLLA